MDAGGKPRDTLYRRLLLLEEQRDRGTTGKTSTDELFSRQHFPAQSRAQRTRGVAVTHSSSTGEQQRFERLKDAHKLPTDLTVKTTRHLSET